MTIKNKDLLEKIISLVLKDAEDNKYWGNDAYGLDLEEQVKFFRYGLSARMPPEWMKYEVKLDPEYAEYIRLSKKFGNIKF